MAINGTHMLFYTTEPEKLRSILRDVLGFTHVDAGHGWLIFRLPPSEVGVHPAEGNNAGTHAISFMCDDISKTIADLRAKGVDVDPEPADHGYGIVTMMHLPGGCNVQLYEPRHPIAADLRPATKPATTTKKAATAVRLRQKATVRRAPKITARPRRRAKKAPRRR